MAVRALACQLPRDLGLPFSKPTHDEIARQARQQGIVATISGKTVWRWLGKDAIRPWCQRSWLWPRDPKFGQKAASVLELYQGVWEGSPPDSNDFVISADEKTSIRARRRLVSVTAPVSSRYGRAGHEYERMGALAYIAAWDVRQAKVSGLCKSGTGIGSFRDLADLVMRQEPHRSAHRVFWMADNGSSRRGKKSVDRLRSWYPNAVLVHTPVRASWPDQVGICFSVSQRKVLTPDDFGSLGELGDRIPSFRSAYEKAAKPSEWKFTRQDPERILSEVSMRQKPAT